MEMLRYIKNMEMFAFAQIIQLMALHIRQHGYITCMPNNYIFVDVLLN